jgi:hypothetical protein
LPSCDGKHDHADEHRTDQRCTAWGNIPEHVHQSTPEKHLWRWPGRGGDFGTGPTPRRCPRFLGPPNAQAPCQLVNKQKAPLRIPIKFPLGRLVPHPAATCGRSHVNGDDDRSDPHQKNPPLFCRVISLLTKEMPTPGYSISIKASHWAGWLAAL